MKMKKLILSLVLVLTILVSSVIPTYAEGKVDPKKAAAFKEICAEVLKKTKDFDANIELSEQTFNMFKTSNANLYSAYLRLFQEGKGDCKTAAYAISKLFTDKGIKNRVLRLIFADGAEHAVVCYEKDECIEGETGLGIVDFFYIRNHEKKELESEQIEFVIEMNKRTLFNWDASTYFSVRNDIINVEAYPPNSSNIEGIWTPPVSINLPDELGGWSELSKDLKEAGIELRVDEKALKKMKFDEIIIEFNEKYNRHEYDSEEAIERMLNEISERLKAAGISNEIKNVKGHQVICYEDDFMFCKNGIQSRVIDFLFAKHLIEKDRSRQALKIADSLKKGIFSISGYYDTLDIISIVGCSKLDI